MQIELKKINKSFGKNHVLKDISFTANSGTAFGLLGRNGSGKTTTIRIIMDVFAADSGEVLVDGKPIDHANVKIGYLPEERGLYPKRTIKEQMIYFGELRGMKAKEAEANAIELLEKIDSMEYFEKKLSTLSKGNQQKIQLAIALLGNPDILILDEPFSGLDPVNAGILKKLVRESVDSGKLVIFSSHQMENVEEFCDDLVIIDHGTPIIEGNLDEIKDTYPKDKIFVSSEKGQERELEKLAQKSSFVESFTQSKNGLVAKLKSVNDKKDFLKEIWESEITFDSFNILVPSLEEIFIEKVGEHHE